MWRIFFNLTRNFLFCLQFTSTKTMKNSGFLWILQLGTYCLPVWHTTYIPKVIPFIEMSNPTNLCWNHTLLFKSKGRKGLWKNIMTFGLFFKKKIKNCRFFCKILEISSTLSRLSVTRGVEVTVVKPKISCCNSFQQSRQLFQQLCQI